MKYTQNDRTLDSVAQWIVLAVVFYALFIMAVGCAPKSFSDTSVAAPANPPTSVLTYPATSLQCAKGGTVVQVADTTTVVCNGAVIEIPLPACHDKDHDDDHDHNHRR